MTRRPVHAIDTFGIREQRTSGRITRKFIARFGAYCHYIPNAESALREHIPRIECNKKPPGGGSVGRVNRSALLLEEFCKDRLQCLILTRQVVG
jgi:hypothetical protein